MKILTATLILTALTTAAVAESFSGNLLVKPTWTHTKTGATTASETFSTLLSWTFTSGTNANQMNQLWASERTLTNGQSEVINLAGGITNSFGTTLTIDEVRMIVIGSDTSNSDSITVGAAASNTFDEFLGDPSDTITIRPGGFFLLTGPDATAYPVSTNGNLQVANDGTNSVTYDIYIGGSSE